jgi:ADP-heptose:LPS heptosyltransferase
MPRLLLHFPHGLGDCVQFSVVLKHLKKYRPDWEVHVRCGRGKHSALIGQCAGVTHDQERSPEGHFDTEATLGWYENYSQFDDKPNSKITNCLAEVFGMSYDLSLGRYQVTIPDEARQRARAYYDSIGAKPLYEGRKYRAVILHYEGNTSTWKKNLKHWQAKVLADQILRSGRVPVVFDWDSRSTLPDQRTIFCPRPGRDDIWGGFGSGDAAVIGALIELAEAYIGVDSGPGKVASATATPTLIVWREHHPIQFHDPAFNTMHLIPNNWRGMPPVQDRPAVAAYFEKHYQYTIYQGDFGLTAAAGTWLRNLLGPEQEEAKALGRTFVVPPGIGDILWALLKIRSIAQDEPIDLVLSGLPDKEINWRAIPFLKRFPFVTRATVLDVPLLKNEEDSLRNDAQGRYRYLADGEQGQFTYLIPNAVLERGERLETWQPEHPLDWDVTQEFDWSNTDKGTDLGRALKPFVAFYLGPEEGNVEEGHNRGFLWEPKHWIELALLLRDRFRIAVVGAHYDRSYYERYVREGVAKAGMKWFNFLGKLEIGETMALLRQAQCFVSYQCGLGIFAHYLGQRVAMWWRPDGDSCHPKRLVAFDNRMKDAWTNPAIVAEGKYLGLLYKRESPRDIYEEMTKRSWLELTSK